MRLFSEQGFRGASVAQIEAAAGLTPGAGGLYHHFGSKEDVLASGVRRHLKRLEPLRDTAASSGPRRLAGRAGSDGPLLPRRTRQPD